MELRGKAALVTGTARVGAAVAEALAARGAAVALSYRSSRGAAEESAERIRSGGGSAVAIQGDLAEESGARALAIKASEAFGRLDVLVNMASAYESVEFEKLDAAAFDRAIAADLRGAYLASIAAAPIMKRNGAGRIINVSDWTAASGRPRYADYIPYYVAKRGVIGLTEALALELAPEILVNAIAPGPILPPPGMGAEEIEATIRATPLARWGGAEEIAKTVLFLVESGFVTGECIRVDGGRHLK